MRYEREGIAMPGGQSREVVRPPQRTTREWVLWVVPFAGVAWIWLSPLSFVPVPWPDDAAFYFPAVELFRWPPRWVMLPQAPFEPTYAQFNFNVMPLYPTMIGIGRFAGIDGSHLLKLYSLGALAACGGALAAACHRAGLPARLALLLALIVTMDPALRWASVIVRPESLIALCGTLLVLGLTLGFPQRWKTRRLWDPVAFLLAVAAYLHFNAIHLVFPVLIAYSMQPRRLVGVGARTALYLAPWLVSILLHPGIFLQQMATQWDRLAEANRWLNTQQLALSSMFQDRGSPEPWPALLVQWAGGGMWVLLMAALGVGLLWPAVRFVRQQRSTTADRGAEERTPGLNLSIPAAWVLGAVWIWHSKPESWFSSYIHFALWTFCGLALVDAWRRRQFRWLANIVGLMLSLLLVFVYVNTTQAARLAGDPSWSWSAFRSYVDCVDRRLTALQSERSAHPLRVWVPMYPDVAVELARRHPDWAYTRHNDFRDRRGLALRHGREVDAVVLTEIGPAAGVSADREGPLGAFQDVRSAWIGERGQVLDARLPGYVIHQLDAEPGWKPTRFFCQRGRWQAFLFMSGTGPGGSNHGLRAPG